MKSILFCLNILKLFLFILSSFSWAGTENSKSSNLNLIDWHFTTFEFNTSNLVYTPFFINGNQLTFYSPNSAPTNNGLMAYTTILGKNDSERRQKLIVPLTEAKNYNYFRAARIARAGNEYWMIVENSGCYSGCDTSKNPKRLAVYRSLNRGLSWQFRGFLELNGKPYIAGWWGHTGLIFNPAGSFQLNTKDLTQNRFITIGEDRNILISADGIHFKSASMNLPFQRDRLTFASIAKTPFGFHLMTNANWSDRYYTTTVRHLFSKDLINWVPLESSSAMKNPLFYKGVDLFYDDQTQKLWALSPCGSGACGILAWITPKDYLAQNLKEIDSDIIPNGEYIQYNGKTAMILGRTGLPKVSHYKIRYFDGRFDTIQAKKNLQISLQGYERQGCPLAEKDKTTLCVGDTVEVSGQIASIMGYRPDNQYQIKYALKFTTGQIDTGYSREKLLLL